MVRGLAERYAVLPAFVTGADNCVSWLTKLFPVVTCGMSVPWLCTEDLKRTRE